MGYPTLPEAITLSEDSKFDLDDIWRDICEELTDPKFKNRSHHNRKTYTVGCGGPLCRKAARDYMRRRASTQARREFVLLDPILLFFFEEAKRRIAEQESQLLNRLTS